MEMPALLPKDLSHYGQAATEEQLFDQLSQKPADLIHFFEFACDDETWSGVDHPAFMRKVFAWLSDQALKDRLDPDTLYYVADQIHLHADNLKSLIPQDMTLLLTDGEVQTNGLLLIASSAHLHSRYRLECKQEPKMVLDVDLATFELINEFLYQGALPNLWRTPPDILYQFIDVARELEIEELALLTEDVLKRYIDEENVFETLKRAQKKRWPHLRNGCMAFINRMEGDIEFFPDAIDTFRFEFKVISEDALAIFEKVSGMITQLIIRGRLISDERLPAIFAKCPQINSLDISDSQEFTEYLLEMPTHLRELVMINCLWIDSRNLQQLFQRCPNLEELDLTSDTQLNVNTWAILRTAPQLTSLKLARCAQINDQQFKVILQSTPALSHLNVEDCGAITDRGFTDLARLAPHLLVANLTKTHIGDGALAEMATLAAKLTSLNLTRCRAVSGKGVLEAALGLHSLRVLHLTDCNIPPEVIQEIRDKRKHLTLVA